MLDPVCAPAASDQEELCMLLQVGLTVGAISVVTVVLMRWYLGGLGRPIDGGIVSEGWLAEQKLGKRDSGWQ
jgi:hypothetical protein